MNTLLPTAITCALIVAAGVLPAANTADEVTLRVTAGNVRSDAGSIVVWVYDSPDRWLGDEYFRHASIVVAGNRRGDEVSLELMLPPGEYALSVFHDIDGNGQLRRNFIGLPKEPAGLSNNAVPRFGPPKYKDARFTLSGSPVEQRIKLD